jgi:oxaloacetate decarboxylase beta subunit
MNMDSFLSIFQGIDVLLHSSPQMLLARTFLVVLGVLLMFLGKKGVLEPLLMIPMGFGMAVINVSVMFFDPLNLHGGVGTLFLEASAGGGTDAVKNASDLMYIMGIDWLQPIYNFTFSNGLIACLIFMGIGSMLDVGFIMSRPFLSIVLALFAELGTIFTLPIAQLFGYSVKQAAAISVVGGADGPMVLFTSLKLAPELFVPIAVVAYLYLGLAYGGYPYLVKFLIPSKKLRGLPMKPDLKAANIKSSQKMIFAVVVCIILCFLFPVASPLFFSLFFGIIIRESGIKQFQDLLSGPILYLSTMFLGLTLGILCEATTIFDPKVLPLLLLGMLSLLISGVGGILGGYVAYVFTGGKVNPVTGIAGVSCVPTTAKVAQKIVMKDNPTAMIMQYALGANIMGVITTAIIAGAFCSIIK